MTAPQPEIDIRYQSLKMSNYLALKAFQSKTPQSLIFLIVNDTYHMVRYDRALLWDMTDTPTLIGISGEAKINKQAPLVVKWTQAVKEIQDPTRAQLLNFSPKEEKEASQATLIWMPINAHGALSLGLWLELWDQEKEKIPPQELINILTNFLMPAYGAAWEKFTRPGAWRKKKFKKALILTSVAAAIASSFIIQVPLRIVAPCEIVPKDPYLVTSPLEGIIDHIAVVPGQSVHKGELLFEYDKQAPMQELEVAKKQVQILQSEIKRASTLGFEDAKERTGLGLLSLKLAKEKAVLQLAEYRASQLSIQAPQSGVVILDNPDEWRGNPVQIGEKILAITDPNKSKVKVWIPEGDNVDLDWERPIHIYLNTDPHKQLLAKISYISNQSKISENQVPSFVAEAEWMNETNISKLGLKGSAVLFGEDISLAYYLLRKPLAHLRNITGF